jgi:translation initiation factor IF-2
MRVGSVEYAVIAFPGNRFNGQIIPAIRELVERDLVRILDLVFVKKDADGSVEAVELSSLAPEERAGFEGLDHKVYGLLNEDDITGIAAALDPNSSAGLIVWENVWSSRFAEAVLASGGVLVANEKVTADVVKAAIEYAESTGAAS